MPRVTALSLCSEAPTCAVLPESIGATFTPGQEVYEYSDMIYTQCNDGLQQFAGSSSMVCDESGNWDGHPPVCLPISKSHNEESVVLTSFLHDCIIL